MASVLAIDQFVLGYDADTLTQYCRRVAEICP
jgi:hypothetical protein